MNKEIQSGELRKGVWDISGDQSSISDEKWRLAVLILIMSVMIAISVTLALIQIYNVSYESQRNNLVEVIQTQANLIDAISRFDREHSDGTHPEGWKFATLSQITDTYLSHEQLSGVGEISLAMQQGDRIVYLFQTRHPDPTQQQQIPFDAIVAEPMRLALRGQSGSIVATDHKGVEILAAYEPLKELGWGIVAQVAVSEIQKPFIGVGIAAAIMTVLLILAGAWMIQRVFGPLVHGLESLVQERTAMLEAEIVNRTEAQETLRQEVSYSRLRRQLATCANESANIQGTLQDSIDLLCHYANWPIGHAYRIDSDTDQLEDAEVWYLKSAEEDGPFRDTLEGTVIEGSAGLQNKVLKEGKISIRNNIRDEAGYVWSALLEDLRVKSSLALPIMAQNEVVAVIEFFSRNTIKPTKNLLQTLDYAKDQLGRVFERQQAEDSLSIWLTTMR